MGRPWSLGLQLFGWLAGMYFAVTGSVSQVLGYVILALMVGVTGWTAWQGVKSFRGVLDERRMLKTNNERLEIEAAQNERELEVLRTELRENRQERDRLRDESVVLQTELATARVFSRGEFSPEELASRHLRGRTFHIADLVRNDTKLRGWTFDNCDIYGPAIVIQGPGTIIQRSTYTSEGVNDFTYETTPERQAHVGAIGLENCTFRVCTFVRVGVLTTREDIDALKAELGS